MGPELSHRLGVSLGGRIVTVAERRTITEAAAGVDTWNDLPLTVRALVQEIEHRPGWLAG